MALNYDEGFVKCRDNALAHAKVAYGLRGDKETVGFAVSHAALAEEEAAKAAFCVLVARGFLQADDIEDAFFSHPTKSWLYHALFREKVVEPKVTRRGAEVTVRGSRLDRKVLKKNASTKVPELKEHDEDRNAGFYVSRKGDQWRTAGEGCSDVPEKLVYRYVRRAWALLFFCDIARGVSPQTTELHGFRIEELPNAGWRITYDEV